MCGTPQRHSELGEFHPFLHELRIDEVRFQSCFLLSHAHFDDLRTSVQRVADWLTARVCYPKVQLSQLDVAARMKKKKKPDSLLALINPVLLAAKSRGHTAQHAS